MDAAAAARRRRRRRVADENRKRAPRACDRCKARKSKCVESRAGQCQRCFRGNLDCRFEREKSPLSPDFAHPSSQNEQQPSTITLDTEQTVGDSVVSDNHELLSPASELSQGLAKHVIADNSRRVPWPNILSRLREAFSLDLLAAPEERDMVAMQARMTRQNAPDSSEYSRLRDAIAAFPPRPVADFLLTVFIRHATDLFFYIDQDQFLIEIDHFYKTPSSSLRSDAGFVCLALAIFALGSQWTPMERPEGSQQQEKGADLGRIFFRQAKTLIPDIIDRPCLRSIQAPFVLGVYLMPANAIGSSYVYMGLALRKALAFDLHLHSEDQNMSAREKEVRRRLWWSLYSLERCTTIKLNRPRSVSFDIITASAPAPHAPLDRLQKFDNIHLQMAYTRLITILDRIADLGDGATDPKSLSSCATWEADLKQWKKSLPPNFKLDHIHPKSSEYRAVFHLYLNYYYAWISMGKVALVTVVRTKLRHHLHPETCPLPISDTVLRLSQSCAKAARKLLQLFENLTSTHNITRFSFTDFQGCSIATIVTLVAGILERDSGYEARTTFGLDCLRRMATGNMTAKMGVRFVEAVQSITNEAARKLNHVGSVKQDSQEVVGSTSDSAYSQWAEWMAMQEQSWENSQTRAPQLGGLSTAEATQRNSLEPTGNSFSPYPASPMGTSGLGNLADELNVAGQPEAEDFNLLFALHNDDQTFLMGLTGLDALDFSGLTDQLQ